MCYQSLRLPTPSPHWILHTYCAFLGKKTVRMAFWPSHWYSGVLLYHKPAKMGIPISYLIQHRTLQGPKSTFGVVFFFSKLGISRKRFSWPKSSSQSQPIPTAFGDSGPKSSWWSYGYNNFSSVETSSANVKNHRWIYNNIISIIYTC